MTKENVSGLPFIFSGGKRGTTQREALESCYENFKIGVLLHEARLEIGMTQEELADKTGTTKS